MQDKSNELLMTIVVICHPGVRPHLVRRDTTSRYGPGALAEMEAALREDRGMAEDAVT